MKNRLFHSLFLLDVNHSMGVLKITAGAKTVPCLTEKALKILLSQIGSEPLATCMCWSM